MPKAAHSSGNGRGGADTRERILIEASRLLATHGYHGTTTRDIADAVGISQPSLFFHFPSKAAIASELYRLDIVPAVGRVERLLSDGDDPAPKLYALVAGELTHILDSPYDLRAHMSYEVLADPALAGFREQVDRFDTIVGSLIEAGQATGVFIDTDPWLAQQLVSALLSRANMFEKPANPTAIAHQAAGLILRTLMKDESAIDEVRRVAEGLIDRYWAASR